MSAKKAASSEMGKAIVASLDSWGATEIRFVNGRVHPKVAFVWKGEQRHYVVPGTPSDTYHAAHNALSDLRHMLGLVKTEKRVGQRRARKAKAAVAPIRVPDCAVPAKADPMAALRRHPAHAVALKQNLDAAWRALFIARSLDRGYVPVMAGATAIGAMP